MRDFFEVELVKLSIANTIYTSQSDIFSILYNTSSTSKTESNTRFTIHPNIASSIAKITLELTENGVTTLELFDSQGTRLDILLSGYQTIGHKELQIDVSQYPSGRYFLNLTTPTISKTEFLEVLR
ncbi:MAG: hypothetical protein CVV25_02490 [Ignavibacteriae bacterium HGW-Ignavibacteriae-4]|nr:MAG: hypothetical protein CVV25_02490 [Ignavibacteriae bacterium HGW-Ignavibacteriae-4]